jgi:hypothetical protein
MNDVGKIIRAHARAIEDLLSRHSAEDAKVASVLAHHNRCIERLLAA